MAKPKILLQLDPDKHASTFDAVVAVDAGVDQLLTRSNVSPSDIENLVHGAMFTRGPADLKSTALFFGGSNVARTQELVEQAKKCFFGPMRVSLLSDPNGSNTTAAAAVICAEKHITLGSQTITILGGTGPVGLRIAQIISFAVSNSQQPTLVRLCSRKQEKAHAACDQLGSTDAVNLVPCQVSNSDEADEAIKDANVVFSAGAAGVELLPSGWEAHSPAVAIDLNAVPPAGIAGVGVMAKGEMAGETICYGAIGVGGLKMKIHKRALEKLFESNDQVLETEAVYELGKTL